MLRYWIIGLSLCFSGVISLDNVIIAPEVGTAENLSAFIISIKIMNRIYNDSLKDHQSLDYKTLRQEVEDVLLNTYSHTPSAQYQEVAEMTFSNGSVIANSTVLFRTTRIDEDTLRNIFLTNYQQHPSLMLDVNISYTKDIEPIPVRRPFVQNISDNFLEEKTSSKDQLQTILPMREQQANTISPSTHSDVHKDTLSPSTTHSTHSDVNKDTLSSSTTHSTHSDVDKDTLSPSTSHSTHGDVHTDTLSQSTIHSTHNDEHKDTLSPSTSYSTHNDVNKDTVFSTSHTPTVPHHATDKQATSSGPLASSGGKVSQKTNGPESSMSATEQIVPAWGIAVLVLAAVILFFVLLLIILLLLCWCCWWRQRGFMHIADPEPIAYYNPDIPLYSTHSTFDSHNGKSVDSEVLPKNQTGMHAVNK